MKFSFTLPFLGLLAFTQVHAQVKPVAADASLQAILDRGDDLLLEKGKLYLIENTLKFKRPGQRIATKDATRISEYATLRLKKHELDPKDPNPDLIGTMRLISGEQLAGIVIEKVILDGNRYELSTPPPRSTPQPAMIFLGGGKAKNQTIRECVMINTRTWSTLKLHEGGTDLVAENNIIIGAGAGARGNGRETREDPFAWGDGVSCAARNSIIRNNLIIDPADAGVVVFGAPGTLIEDNVIASVSRESLGAINLVDPLEFYVVDEEKAIYDYRGVVVRNNLIDAFGGRIHIAFPIGPMSWAPKHKGKTLQGGEIYGNLITGGAGGYGYVLNGIDGFKLYDNQSTAQYSGIGDGKHRIPPDDPGAFLYNPKLVTNSQIQKEFQPMQRHLDHLLRCNHGPRNISGYRVYPYGQAEARAVIGAAFHEMLGRKPSRSEAERWTVWLNETLGTADQLRRSLMITDEFIRRFGYIDPLYLHPFRTKLWLEVIDSVMPKLKKTHGNWPAAKEIYKSAQVALTSAHRISGIKKRFATLK
jgi:hypothetical protein